MLPEQDDHLDVNKVLAPETPVISVYTCSCKEMNRLKKVVVYTTLYIPPP